MPIGTVKWFNNQKGYGFINQVDGPDVFAHYTAIAGEGFRTLKEGEEVEFEIAEGPKGPQAANIRRKGMSTVPDSVETGGEPEGDGEPLSDVSEPLTADDTVDEAGEVSDAPETLYEDEPVDEAGEETTEEEL